jgi:Mce-associated membrane protein
MAAAVSGRVAWRTARRLATSRAAVAAVALIIVVAGLAMATGVLFVRVRSSQAAEDARTASVAAAKQQVPALLSYSYQTFRADLARAEADTTGGFRGTYAQLMSGQVEPAAMRSHVVSRASVSGASVIDAGPGTATLLLFLSEQTKTDAKQEAVLNNTAVRVSMRDVNGTWLVAGLVPRS